MLQVFWHAFSGLLLHRACQDQIAESWSIPFVGAAPQDGEDIGGHFLSLMSK